MSHGASKAIILVVLLCAPLAAYAQALDLTPSQDRYLSDPNFLPFAGQLYGTSAYAHGWVEGTTVDSKGNEISSFHINTNRLDQYLAYGITDDLMVDASLEYVPASYREIDTSLGRSQTIESSGISDPTFGMTWRVFDQRTWPVDLDLLGSYTPDLVDAHTATDFEDATVARGGQSGSVGAALGYETQGFGIRGGFDANLYGTSDRLDLTNGGTIQTQGFTDYTVLLSTQARLSDLFSVNAGVSHVFGASQTVANLANGAPRLLEPGGETALQFALNYNFIPQRVVISATYAHEFYGNGLDEFYDPAQDTETRGKNGDIAGVKLSYVMP